MSSDYAPPSSTARAATILLIRDRPSFQVLMVTRNEKMAFAAGALVFPGGKVDSNDEDKRWESHAHGWREVSAEQRVLRIAAIRETFEETGLLVSLRTGGKECDVKTIAIAREEVCAGRLDFLSFVRQAGVILDMAQPIPFAHWITPEFMPKRFDTHFFIMGTDTEQRVAFDGSEITHAEWIAPREALRYGMSKERILAFPTRLNLQMLAESRSVEEASCRARERVMVPVQSRIEQRESGRVLTIRSDAGYGCVEEPVSELAGRGHAIPAVAGGSSKTPS
ncbi:NUDIX domain-containing protein [Bradyrhizobium sp. AUGA SZCCT0240]|uniref:NUDIX hydrolase n=1 Tax=Bradyrhizobium sp. AUGA SZCCT0240 TaxID=2807669 RepID=UPI001BA62046|nr:NUDIX domain-containing protein [Bradyrhizobium sp. AUGA SZCCT0240]MBR1252314.1 NUDIX domain-containing protein [Bradyrhizobium sp. AUGA SZCCT0240]